MSDQKKKRLGGYAFCDCGTKGQPGMTVRTWLAGHALAGLSSNPDLSDLPADELADQVVASTDAVLEKLDL